MQSERYHPSPLEIELHSVSTLALLRRTYAHMAEVRAIEDTTTARGDLEILSRVLG